MMMVTETRPPKGTLPGEWDPPTIPLDPPTQTGTVFVDILRLNTVGLAFTIDDVLTPADCERLKEAMLATGNLQPVSVMGRTDIQDDRIGSVRATAWAPELGAALWEKIKAAGVEIFRTMEDNTATDWAAPTLHRKWESCGVSPVLRFMKYEKGGKHAAHYDAGYNYPDDRRTLMSLVFYLSDVAEDEGGCTRFIEDGQGELPVWDRNHEDWDREVLPEEVLCKSRPKVGRVLIFDHRLCHDVEEFTGKARFIIRGDLVFRALD